jgi:hypothetical protein
MRDLKYLGVRATTPPNFKTRTRAPRVTDIDGVLIGDLWHEKNTENLWVLTSKARGIATWTSFGLNVLEDLTVGTLRADGAGNVTSLADGIDNQVFMGSTGNPAEWGTLGSTGGTVTITRNATGINFEAAGGTDADTFECDDANIVVPTPASHIYITGSANLNTTGAVAHTISINMEDNVTLAGNLVAVDGTFSGDVDVTGDVTASNVTFTGLGGQGVVQSSAGGVLSSSDGAAGEVLIGSSGAGPPVWNTITGGTGINVDSSVDNQITVNATGGGVAGQTWVTRSSRPNATGEIYDGIAYGGGYWVAVSRNTALRYSADLTGNWTNHGTAPPAAMYAVTYGNGSWVAVGNSGNITYINGNPTGVWTNTTAGSDRFNSITYGGGFFVAVTETGRSYYAANPGGPWALTPGSPTGVLRDVTYGNGYFVAAGSPGGGNVYYTANPGVAWTPNSAGSRALSGVTFGNNTFVVCGEYGNFGYIVGNPTGVWTFAEFCIGGSSGLFEFNGIAYGNGYFAACGDDGMIMITSDPATPWIVANPGVITGNATQPFDFNDMVYGNGAFAAVGGEFTSSLFI